MKATKFSEYLQDRETLKFVDTPHWIYILEAAIWSSMIIALGWFLHSYIADAFIYPRLDDKIWADGLLINIAAFIAKAALWGSLIIGLILFLNRLVFWASTYVFASDRRLYMKTGLIRVLVKELSFDEVRKTDINYGIIGRFIGYGKLMMDARFVEDTDLPFINHPETFAKIIHNENDLASDINLSYVTNNMKNDIEEVVPEKEKVKDQVAPMRDHREFADFAFSGKEKDTIILQERAEDDAAADFTSATKKPNKRLIKPAAQSAKFAKA